MFINGLKMDRRGRAHSRYRFSGPSVLDTDLEAVDETFKLFSTIPNFKIYVTELDISAYAFEDYTSRYPDYMIDEIKELVAKSTARCLIFTESTQTISKR